MNINHFTLSKPLINKYGKYMAWHHLLALYSMLEYKSKNGSLTENQERYIDNIISYAKEVKSTRFTYKLSEYHKQVKNPFLIDRDATRIKKRLEKYRGLRGFYVIQFVYGIKIGISECLSHRITAYTMPWSQPIKRIYFIGVKSYETTNFDYAESDKLESYLKRELIHLRLGNGHNNGTEFFVNLTIKKLKEHINKFSQDLPPLKLVYKAKELKETK